MTVGYNVEPPVLKFHVEDFGYLQQGDFELKPLTIFCGQNNTGKTWAMYALYDVLKGFSLTEPLPGISNLIRDLKTTGKIEWDAAEWIDAYFSEIEDFLTNSIRKRLPVSLNSDEEIVKNSTFTVLLSKNWILRYFSGLLTFFSIIERNEQKLFYGNKEQNKPFQFILLDKDLVDLEISLSNFLVNHLLGKEAFLLNMTFLIPAERNGLNLFFRELNFTRSQALHLSTMDLKGKETYFKQLSLYAKPIADYIDWLNKLSWHKQSLLRFNVPFANIIPDLEKISGGSYDVDIYNKISFIRMDSQQEQSHLPIDLHLASSTANSLASLWFFMSGLGTWSGRGTLMIDEPELNLHPSNQRAFARLLAKLVNAGTKVIISTHSDYLIREINSLIMLSQEHPQRADLMGKYGYSEAETLKPEQVGAYLFDKNSIQAMEVSKDEGIIATTFDEVINDLNETSDDIFYTYRHWSNKVEDAA